MVCLVQDTIMSNYQPNDTDIQVVDEIDIVDSDENSNNDDPLKLRCMAGGSIIDYPSLYSPNGEFLFVILKEIIQIYSTTTGQPVKNLEGATNKIIGMDYEIGNNETLIACSESGEIIKWKWESGIVLHKFQLNLKSVKIKTFNTLNISSDNSYALIIFTKPEHGNKQWLVVDINTGKQLNCDLKMSLSSKEVVVTSDMKFHYFAIVQDYKMYIVDYRNWTMIRWKSAHKVPFTYVKCHPTEELIATGDALGRIYLWREIWNEGEPKSTKYHWHHTKITSIEFTNTGSGFYSSGLEAVLVKWNIDRPDSKCFLPRMTSPIYHITISKENLKLAVSTSDNAIHILDNQRNTTCLLQNFTYISDDKTMLDKFPVGLKLNPQSNCLCLNGRVGYLQFFSTHTRNLLYNMDIVFQNRLSIENQKILYNTEVTKAAFNVDWMVTAEVWNDYEHFPEVRIKFWEFQKENQSYCLNTNIELPHEGGIQALEFSNLHESDNLLCVSAGNDNIIKIWSLGEANNNKSGKAWYCTSRTNYKDMRIKSVCFSLDGSLLAAGYDNCLCIYKSENLKIKTVLTSPICNDGTFEKVQIRIPKVFPQKDNKNIKNSSQSKNENIKENKILELFVNFIENNEQELVKEIKKSKEISYNRIDLKQFTEMIELNDDFRSILFKKILSDVKLNLFQKLYIFQKLKIMCTVPEEERDKILKYIALTIFKAQQVEDNLHKQIYQIEKREKFKAKYRLCKYFKQQKSVDDTLNNKLIPLLQTINFDNSCDIKQTNLKSNTKKDDHNRNAAELNGNCDVKQSTLQESPILSTMNNQIRCLPSLIKRVVFATGDFAHLVVACTEHRILIWNILTLKLQCVLKLSIQEITVDPITSLFAAFTINNELYVFLPNAPMPLYHRTNLPNVKGACWMPRKYPKSQSINLDWQAISILYFLTDKQELMYLSSSNEAENASAQLSNEVQGYTQYTTFGTYALKQMKSVKMRNTSIGNTSSVIGLLEKHSIKSLIEMPTYTMPPAKLLCHSFTASLVGIKNKKKSKSNSYASKTAKTNVVVDNDSDDDDIDSNTEDETSSDGQKKKKIQKVPINNLKKNTNTVIELDKSKELQAILNECINLSF